METDTDFLREIGQFRPDLILSDFHLPSFNGLAALALAQEKSPEVPFIFVSGAIGEEVAIDSLKRGATDYVLKDRLSRLVPAVKTGLREAVERRERRQAEQSLRESEQRYRLLVGSIPAVVYKGYTDWSVDFIDNKIEELTGYPREEFDSRRLKWIDLMLPEDIPTAKKAFLLCLQDDRTYYREFRIRPKTAASSGFRTGARQSAILRVRSSTSAGSFLTPPRPSRPGSPCRNRSSVSVS